MRLRFFLLLLLGIGFLNFGFQFAPPPSGETSTAPNDQQTEVNWITWEEAMTAIEKEPKPIVVDVWTTWCGWCKKMDAQTFGHPIVAKYIQENYYAVKLNGEMKRDLVFKGKTYKFVNNGRRGYHEFPAALMNGRMSYPTVIFINEKLELLQSLPGFKGPKDIFPILDFFATGAYKTTAWNDYLQKVYKSPFNAEKKKEEQN